MRKKQYQWDKEKYVPVSFIQQNKSAETTGYQNKEERKAERKQKGRQAKLKLDLSLYYTQN